MSDFVQGRLELVHSVQPNKPTGKEEATKPNGNKEEEAPKSPSNRTPKNDDAEQETNIIRKLGGASVVRRVSNTGFSIANNISNYIYQGQALKQQFLGNNRGAEIIRMKQQASSSIIQFANQTASTTITSIALGNKSIYLAYALGIIVDVLGKTISLSNEIKYYNLKRERAIYEAKYSQDRLVKGVYNRRNQ